MSLCKPFLVLIGMKIAEIRVGVASDSFHTPLPYRKGRCSTKAAEHFSCGATHRLAAVAMQVNP